MKKLLTILIVAGGALTTSAQEKAPVAKDYTHDADLGRWVIDLNMKGGIATQDFKTATTSANYLNGVNMNTGQLKFKNGYSFGGDANIGFFFGRNRHFGLGAGIQLMSQHGDAVLDNYHVFYYKRASGAEVQEPFFEALGLYNGCGRIDKPANAKPLYRTEFF
jgi:hypothetical protein